MGGPGKNGCWNSRIIHGERLGLDAVPGWLLASYETFANTVSHPRYPCFFGTEAERNGCLYYGFVAREELDLLPSTLRTFTELAASSGKRSNLAVFFQPEPDRQTHEFYREKLWQILQFLHSRDEEPLVAPADPNDPLWEFCFAGVQMFVVAASPSYLRRKSRNLGPGMVMLFQPREVFIDNSTSEPFSSDIRAAIRKRLLEWDEAPHHAALGSYGDPENREWKQYFLPDDDAPVIGVCPFKAQGVDPGFPLPNVAVHSDPRRDAGKGEE